MKFSLCFRCQRALYPQELANFIAQTESITTSGNPSKGEGLDAHLEEINKNSKTWEHGAMSAREWISIFRNYDNLTEVCTNTLVSKFLFLETLFCLLSCFTSIKKAFYTFQLRLKLFSWCGLTDPKSEAEREKRKDSLENEVLAWRLKLRKEK